MAGRPVGLVWRRGVPDHTAAAAGPAAAGLAHHARHAPGHCRHRKHRRHPGRALGPHLGRHHSHPAPRRAHPHHHRRRHPSRTLASPLAPAARGRLRGPGRQAFRLSSPQPPQCRSPGWSRARAASWSPDQDLFRACPPRKVVNVAFDDSQFRIIHDGNQLSAHPRTVIKEVSRRSASGHVNYENQARRKASPEVAQLCRRCCTVPVDA